MMTLEALLVPRHSFSPFSPLRTWRRLYSTASPCESLRFSSTPSTA